MTQEKAIKRQETLDKYNAEKQVDESEEERKARVQRGLAALNLGQ